MLGEMTVLRILAAFGCGWLASALAGEAAIQPISSAHLENCFRLSSRVLSGAEPRGEAAFAELKRLGVTAIISVDGSKPDTAGARQQGLRYFHLPMGYGGATRSDALRLVKAAEVAGGTVYVHCHHGRHRGPAAAAILCRARENWDAGDALRWLKQAGTSSDYPGLFGLAASFRPPTAAELREVSPDLPESAAVAQMVQGMVEIDSRWDRLKDWQEPGDGAPAIAPEQESLLLAEAFRELTRSAEASSRGPDFLACLKEAEEDAWSLHSLFKGGAELSPQGRAKADALLLRARQSCAACHKRYRN